MFAMKWIVILAVVALLLLALAAGLIVLFVCLIRNKKNQAKGKEQNVIFVD